jgi:TPP-dependent pyruvate/acetoin dehydrogenase alpha subunit
LIAEKTASEKDLDKLDQDAAAEIENAVQFAEDSPEPTWEELVNSVYVEGVG